MLNKHTSFNSSELNSFFFSKANSLFSFLKSEISFEKFSWFHFLIIINVVLLSTSIGLTGNNLNFNNWNLGALTIAGEFDSNIEEESIKGKSEFENLLGEKNVNAENLPNLIHQLKDDKVEEYNSLMLPTPTGCPNIQIVDLRNTPGFPQLFDLNKCGDADTLSMVIFTDEPGTIAGFEMSLNLEQGMRYAGFEEVHYGGGCTSISNSDPTPNNPSFIANGITCGEVFVANIGLEADCNADITSVNYFIEIEYTYTWFPVTGIPVACEGSFIIGNDFNSAIKNPVLNMFPPNPTNAILTALNSPTCQTIDISQDGLGAALNEMEFAVCGLDVSPSSVVSVSSMTANGIDVLPQTVFNPADTSLRVTFDSTHFVANTFPNPMDGKMNSAEVVTVNICYQTSTCPSSASFPFTYKATYGCFDELCDITSQVALLNVDMTGALPPTITATLDNGITICGADGLVTGTFENTNPNTDQNVFTNLHIGFQACGMETINFTNVLINGTPVPYLFAVIGDDLSLIHI